MGTLQPEEQLTIPIKKINRKAHTQSIVTPFSASQEIFEKLDITPLQYTARIFLNLIIPRE